MGEFVRSKSFRRIISICFFTTLLLSIFSLLSASALALTGASVSTDVQLTEIMDGKTGTCVSSGDQKVDCAFDIYGGNMNHSPGSVWSSKVSMKNTGKSDGVFNLTPSVCSETVDGNSADPVSADTLCNYMNIAIVQNGTPLWSGTATELGSVGVLNLTPLNISASSDFVFNLSVAPNVPDGIQGSSISQPLVWSLTADSMPPTQESTTNPTPTANPSPTVKTCKRGFVLKKGKCKKKNDDDSDKNNDGNNSNGNPNYGAGNNGNVGLTGANGSDGNNNPYGTNGGVPKLTNNLWVVGWVSVILTFFFAFLLRRSRDVEDDSVAISRESKL